MTAAYAEDTPYCVTNGRENFGIGTIHVSSVLPQKIEKVPRHFPGRLILNKQCADYRHRIRPGLDHAPRVRSRDSANGYNRFARPRPGAAHGIETDDRLRISLRSSSKDWPHGHIIRTAQLRQSYLLIGMRGNSNPPPAPHDAPRIFRGKISLTYMHAVPRCQHRKIGTVVQNQLAIGPEKLLANRSRISQNRLRRAGLVSILNQANPGCSHLLRDRTQIESASLKKSGIQNRIELRQFHSATPP